MADPAPTLEDLLRSCSRTAVHLEMRDGYMRSDPRFAAWQAGVRTGLTVATSWLSVFAHTTSRGVAVRRARIVSEPVSDYVRFEHHLSSANVTAGEEIRWLPRRRASDLALPGNDFWLFDDAVAVFHHFDGDGELAPDDEEVRTDTAAVKLCADAFAAVWTRAVPHPEYKVI
ncbi:DUF6879 family protein [Streptomyces sp. NBC_01190]|uniref:DUF6879 family protein n=1 Tax=Streptomyces sp. NBC_01190 TaxID=2903767 RepID=UPI003870B013